MTSKMFSNSGNYFASFPDFSPLTLQQFGPRQQPAGRAPAIRIFLARYHAYPCKISCLGEETNALFHIPTVVAYLEKNFEHDSTKDRTVKKFHQRSKKSFVCQRLCDLNNGIMIDIINMKLTNDNQNPNHYTADYSDDYFLVSSSILIYYLPEQDLTAQNMAQTFAKMTVFSDQSSVLQMVCRNQYGYYLESIKIRKPMITDLALHYGQNFVSIHEKIMKKLNKKDGKGIVLLHGLPGTGKTHYIRYLIHEVEDKTQIYVPPDMAKSISAPEFLPFLMQHPDSVLIIEDAENVIRDRTETTFNPSQAVANILNLSDGLLGDAVHMQIIATFNCPLTTIDKALLRKGRLIADYEFGKLDVNSAKTLSDKLGFGTEHILEPMTLAEIYNQEQREVAQDDD